MHKVLKSSNNIDYIIAGDSVTGETKIVVNGKSISIEDYYNENNSFVYKDDYNKSYVKPVKSDITATVNMKSKEIEDKKILHIMKHKVKKEIFKITVGDDSVIVTEDHSIIVLRNNRLMSVKPKELSDSDEIINIRT
jgi:intein/homing endonuclease